MLVLGALGILSGLLHDGFRGEDLPEASCRDAVIMLDPGIDVSGTPCTPEQTLVYMRDYDGGRYIICSCPGHAPMQTAPMTPFFTDPIEPDIELTPDDVSPDGTYL